MRDAQDLVFFADGRPVLVRLRITVEGKALHDAWDAAIDKVFSYLDVNKDGVLDRKEAARVPPVQALFNTGFFFGGGGAPSFAQLDSDRDGKVSKAELAAYYRNNGASPFQFSYGGRQTALSGLAAKLPQRLMRAGASADALNKRLFELLDTNKDGKLSLEELKAGPAILAKLDANDDEMLTADELMGNVGPADPSTELAFRLALLDSRMRANRPGGPVHVVTSRRADSGLARQLLQRYGGGGRGKPPAKKLTAKMLGLDKETFGRLDVDGDGELDAEELARFALRAPDLEFGVNLTKRGPTSVKLLKRAKGTPHAGSVQNTKDGPVLNVGNTRLELTAARPPGGGFRADVRQRYIRAFKEADRDNNGYLDEKEAMASPFFRGTFKLMDRDGDGKLFLKEMLAFLDKSKEVGEAAMASIVSLQLSDQGRGLFDLLDTDRDGRLSVRELRRLPDLIKMLDRDGDGMLSPGEVPRSYRAQFAQGPAQGGGPYRFAKNFAPGMRPAPPPPVRTAGPRWFRKMDRNRDGDVSRREFIGTDEQFKAIDTDGDGLISLEEAIAYDKRMRARRAKKD
jgi:Ca2+-binding EF-hand superfamily protein